MGQEWHGECRGRTENGLGMYFLLVVFSSQILVGTDLSSLMTVQFLNKAVNYMYVCLSFFE